MSLKVLALTVCPVLARPAVLMDHTKGPITVYPGAFGSQFIGPQHDALAYQSALDLAHQGMMNQAQAGLADVARGLGAEFIGQIKSLKEDQTMSLTDKMQYAATYGLGAASHAAADVGAKSVHKVSRVSGAAANAAVDSISYLNPTNAQNLAGLATGKAMGLVGGVQQDFATGAQKSKDLAGNVAANIATNAINHAMEGASLAFGHLTEQQIGLDDIWSGTLTSKIRKGFSDSVSELQQQTSDVVKFSADQVGGAAWNVKAQMVDNVVKSAEVRYNHETENTMREIHDAKESMVQNIIHA